MAKSKSNEPDFEDFDSFLEDIDRLEEEPDNGPQKNKPSAVGKVFHGPSGREIEFVRPTSQESVTPEYLKDITLETQDLLSAEETSEVELERARVLIAFPGDRLAFETENKSAGHGYESTTLLEAGFQVRRTSKGEYVAETYGFVSLYGNKLSISSPIKINKDVMRVLWLIPARHPKGVDRQMLAFWLSEQGVEVEPVAELDAYIKGVNDDGSSARVFAIVSGHASVPGEDGRIEWLIDIDKKSGQESSNGRIDFRDRNFVVEVEENQPLAILIPPGGGTPGQDVKGRTLPVVEGKAKELFADEESIAVEQTDAGTQYIATVTGVFHYVDDTISVSKVLVVAEGVSYKTGNIEFAGDIIVEGTVTPGFSVLAEGNITVSGAVESGSEVVAKGDVVIEGGVVGKRTIVRAGGRLQVDNVHDAKLIAGGDIEIGSYAWHANLRSGGIVRVKKGDVKNGGCIMGGEAWATHGIDTYTAGTPSWSDTELMAGILSGQSLKLDSLQKTIEGKNTHLRSILDFFGLASVDLEKIKEMIKNAEGAHRKGLILRTKILGKTSKVLQELLNEREKIKEKIGPAPENTEIRIREIAYANVTVRIGNKKRKLDSEMNNVLFRLERDELVVEKNGGSP